MSRRLVPLCAALVCACATPSTLMVGDGNRVVRCAAYGHGLVGVGLAGDIRDQCVADHARLGYLPFPVAFWGISLPTDWSATPVTAVKIIPGSPADVSGIKVGDTIRELDGTALASVRDAWVILSRKAPGEQLRARIERGGAPFEVVSVLARH